MQHVQDAGDLEGTARVEGASDARAEAGSEQKPNAVHQPEVVAGEAADASSADTAVVPVAGTLRSEESRGGFWRRISLKGRSAPATDDRVLARLDVLDARIQATRQTVENRIDALDRRFTEVWEVEEQISQLVEIQEAVNEVRDGQQKLETRLADTTRRTTLVASGTALLVAAVAVTVLVRLA